MYNWGRTEKVGVRMEGWSHMEVLGYVRIFIFFYFLRGWAVAWYDFGFRDTINK
jgi:hypothetical protein